MTERLMNKSKPTECINTSFGVWELELTAYNLETYMLKNGAVPGKDYTILDLYKLASDYMKSKAIECVWDALDDLAKNLKNE